MSEPETSGTHPSQPRPVRLRDALLRARIEAADRTGVVVDLRDAEVARLEILNDALDPLFVQVPEQIDLFDRGISQGDTPRLWIDSVARRMIEREHAMVVLPEPKPEVAEQPTRSRVWPFVFGFILGAAALFGIAVLAALRSW